MVTIVNEVSPCNSMMEVQDKAKLKMTTNFAELKKLPVSSCNSQTERQEDAKELERTTNSN